MSCTPDSGSNFPIGTITVVCTATDDAGNAATVQFWVEVVNPPPVADAGAEQTVSLHAAVETVPLV